MQASIHEPLQRDIDWLHSRLNEVRPSEIAELLASVDAAAKRMLQSAAPDPTLAGLSLDQIRALLKHLAISFHLRNKAEQVHIVRINRQREHDATFQNPRAESLSQAIATLASQSVSRYEILAQLAHIDIGPTLTAHPTESRRRSVVNKQTTIGDILQQRERTSLTPAEQANLDSLARQTLALLLKTDEIRAKRLDVIDEVRNGTDFLAGPIWNTIPNLYRDLAHALSQHPDEQDQTPICPASLPAFIHYRSWIGGDRDGNPNVTATLTRQAFNELRAAAIARHNQTLEHLYLTCSISDKLAPATDELTQSLKTDAQTHPLDPDSIRHLYHEPIRIKIRHVQAKLNDLTYTSANYIEDLRIIQRTIQHAGLEESVRLGPIADALITARTFGFHLASLDIRQHSRIHEAAVAEMLASAAITSDYASLSEAERTSILTAELQTSRPLLDRHAQLSPPTQELLDSLAVFAAAIEREPRSVSSYIVSMTHTPSDLLEVLILLREVGLWRTSSTQGVSCPIDVVPLFETVDDLAAADSVMDTLFTNSAYRAQLIARDFSQEIMLGYSDSNKDGGYLAANWNLHTAQSRLANLCTNHDIAVRFFHGRGGSVARGGGRAHRAILASPAEAPTSRIRFTEQGEVISFRYAMPELAHRHLEQIANAVICTTIGKHDDQPFSKGMASLLEKLAETSRIAWRNLIDHPDFWPWFVAATPVRHIGQLPIASRPVSRAKGQFTFENLRAIPWVFSWTQVRYNAPGWFGLGTALATHVTTNPNALNLCKDAYHTNGTFQAFIDNAQQELARARLPVAAWYAHVANSTQGHAIHTTLATEFNATRDAILAITGQAELLDNNPVIKDSIARRNPNTDIINALQVELLRRHRNADPNEQESQQAELAPLIFLSVNALAAAMQSTG